MMGVSKIKSISLKIAVKNQNRVPVHRQSRWPSRRRILTGRGDGRYTCTPARWTRSRRRRSRTWNPKNIQVKRVSKKQSFGSLTLE